MYTDIIINSLMSVEMSIDTIVHRLYNLWLNKDIWEIFPVVVGGQEVELVLY